MNYPWTVHNICCILNVKWGLPHAARLKEILSNFHLKIWKCITDLAHPEVARESLSRATWHVAMRHGRTLWSEDFLGSMSLRVEVVHWITVIDGHQRIISIYSHEKAHTVLLLLLTSIDHSQSNLQKIKYIMKQSNQ